MDNEITSIGSDCSEKIAHAEMLYRHGRVEESRVLLSTIRGMIETYQENPFMMSDWEAHEVAAIKQAWNDLWATWGRIYPDWKQRPPQWQ